MSPGRRVLAGAVAGLLLAGGASAAGGAPAVFGGAVVPSDWNNFDEALVSWGQFDFDPPRPGPAIVEIRPLGVPDDDWSAVAALPGPLASGVRFAGLDVSDLDGEYQVRVAIAGVPPAAVGVLRLDRTGPRVSVTGLAPARDALAPTVAHVDDGVGMGTTGATWIEINGAADGTAAGDWIAAGPPVPGGLGAQRIVVPLEALGDGAHLARAVSRDRLGNLSVTDLGPVIVDRSPADLAGSAVITDPDDPRSLVVRVRLQVSDRGLAPLGEYTVAPAGSPPEADLRIRDHRYAEGYIRLPRAGAQQVEIRLPDAAGNVGTLTVPVYVPTLDDFPRWILQNPGGVPAPAPAASVPASAGRSAGAGARLAWTAAVRFHRARAGLRLTGLPRTVRRPAVWARLLGPGRAAVYAGATVDGNRVLLGPRATAGLTLLQRAAGGRLRRVARADIDRIVTALAVVLHESLHATGPVSVLSPAVDDPATSLEEALTEAATVDLLARYVNHLRVGEPLRSRLRAGVRRYRPAYRAQVVWMRRVSVRATRAPVNSPPARAWRIAAADTYGDDRIRLLARATGEDELALIRGLPLVGAPG